jgi:tRNA A37 methylthiotransferase MiaB
MLVFPIIGHYTLRLVCRAQAILPGSLGKFYIETYGCQMNSSDTEIVQGVLQSAGYARTDIMTEADVVLVNTCAIRENAEAKVRPTCLPQLVQNL